MSKSEEILLDRLSLRETALMQQADAIDVKASVMVVAVTFLASQTTLLLSHSIGSLLKWEQVASIVLQVVAGILLILILKVHSYSGETTEKYANWRNELIAYHEGDNEKVEKELWTGITDGIVQRCELATGINNSKADKLSLAYNLIAVSFLLNLVVLFFQPFKWI
jgi:hypothetical protein